MFETCAVCLQQLPKVDARQPGWWLTAAPSHRFLLEFSGWLPYRWYRSMEVLCHHDLLQMHGRKADSNRVAGLFGTIPTIGPYGGGYGPDIHRFRCLGGDGLDLPGIVRERAGLWDRRTERPDAGCGRHGRSEHCPAAGRAQRRSSAILPRSLNSGVPSSHWAVRGSKAIRRSPVTAS